MVRMPRIAAAAALSCMIAAPLAGAAEWVDPAPFARHPAKASGTSSPAAPRATAALPDAGSVGQGAPADAGSPLEVAQWSLSSNGGGRRLTMVLDGGQAAVDRLRNGGLSIRVSWARDGSDGPGAPTLVTDIAVGRPDLAPTFAAQVQRSGHFQWHSWAEKRALSRGNWSVTLTYPDGRPVLCKPEGAPCRLSFTVG